MSHNDKSDNQSQNSNGHPLLNALSQFGRSFFPQNADYPGLTPPDHSPDKVITIWERLQANEAKRKPSAKAVNGVKVQRIEPKEPIDFLEHYRRKN